MSKPTVVCVPGAWHSPEVYTKVFDILNRHGYPTVGVSLPSVGAKIPQTSFDGDVKAIRDCLEKLVIDEEKDVILVTHSYSGMPGVEAPVGLGKDQRKAEGKSGGVVRMVFIMSFAMPEGFQPDSGNAKYPEWMQLDSENGIATVLPEDAKRVFYNDLTPEEADLWASKLDFQSAGVYRSTTTYAAWRYIPSTFVIGEKDKTSFTPELVDYMINTARSIQPTAFDVIEKVDAGHSIMISRPEWLANVLRRAAGESVES